MLRRCRADVLTEECPTLFLYANENITLINTDKVERRDGIPDRLLHAHSRVDSSRIKKRNEYAGDSKLYDMLSEWHAGSL